METFNKKLKAILLLIGIVALTIPTFATIYEDAEDNATTGWISYGNTTNSSIENVEDMQRGSRVIKLTGNGKETGYRLGNRVGRASYVGAWHNKTEKILKWSMKYEEPFRIYIPITTEHGNRFLVYTNQSESKKGKIRGGKVRYGLGTDSTGGAWHTFKRDLEADWNAFMPSDPFVAVNGFFIKGSGYIDDIMSLDGNVSNWRICGGDTNGSTIENIFDLEIGDIVTQLTGNGVATLFCYNLGNRREKILQWTMKYNEPFRILIPIRTENGNRYLIYNNQSVDTQGKIRGGKIYYGLGEDSIDGTWHTFTRDLEADLKAYEPNNSFSSVNGFTIRGSGYMYNILSLDDNILNWTICCGDTNGSTIENIFDLERGSIVTQLIGNGMATLFCYNLGNKVEKKLQWSMKYDEDFKIYVLILTEQGYRYLVYDNESTDKRGKIRGGKIYYGLGEDSIDGTWHTFTRDLEADLNAFEFNNSIISVNKFSIRGSGRVDDISLGSLFPF